MVEKDYAAGFQGESDEICQRNAALLYRGSNEIRPRTLTASFLERVMDRNSE